MNAVANSTTTNTDWLARHPFDDAVVHLMPQRYALAIKAKPNNRLAIMEAKVRCNAQKRIKYVAILPKSPAAEGELPENMCAKCMSHVK